MLSRVLENAEFLFGGSFLLFSLSSDKIYAKAKIKVKFFDSLNFQQEIAIHLSNQYSTRLHKHSSDHQKHFYYRRCSSCHSSLRGVPLHPLTQHFAHQTSADYNSVLTFSNNIFIIQACMQWNMTIFRTPKYAPKYAYLAIFGIFGRAKYGQVGCP